MKVTGLMTFMLAVCVFISQASSICGPHCKQITMVRLYIDDGETECLKFDFPDCLHCSEGHCVLTDTNPLDAEYCTRFSVELSYWPFDGCVDCCPNNEPQLHEASFDGDVNEMDLPVNSGRDRFACETPSPPKSAFNPGMNTGEPPVAKDPNKNK